MGEVSRVRRKLRVYRVITGNPPDVPPPWHAVCPCCEMVLSFRHGFAALSWAVAHIRVRHSRRF